MGTGDIAREAQEKRLLKAASTYIGRLGEAVMYLEQYIQDPKDDTTFITHISFKVRYGSEGDILAVLRAETGEGKVVAFHSGDRLDDVVLGLASRLRNGSLRWREDTPYGDG